MKTSIILIVVLCAINLCQSKDSNMADFATSLRKFTAEMFSKMEEHEFGGNKVFSPTSVAHLLGMMLNGANGTTAREITLALQINRHREYDDDNYHKLFRKTFRRLFDKERVKGIETLLAARIFLENDYELYSDYTADLETYYHADVERMDFSDATAAAEHINSWISEATEEQIKELIDSESLGGPTRFVLTNALYFKAAWADELEEEGKDRPFNADYREPKNISFMGRIGEYEVHFGDNFKAISIPYQGEDNKLIIVLPDDEKAMREFSKRNSLIAYLRNLPDQRWRLVATDFSMPKFSLEYEVDAKRVLEDLGVRRLFDERNADLSKMAEEKLHCSDIKHKAKVTMNEEGTEAAAASIAVIGGRSAGGPFVFNVDKPFFFIIRRENYFLFFGKVMNPEYSEK